VRYAVMGAGAVGSYVGGMLARAGLPVTLIGRGAHVAAVARDGLEVGGLVGPFRVRPEATDSAEGVKSADVVLLCVKSQDTGSACAAMGPFLAPDVPIVSLQNGVRNVDRIDSVLGPGRGVGGSIVFNAVFLEPGRVLLTTSGEILAGATSRNGRFGPVMARFAREARQAGLELDLSSRIEGLLWSKLLINLNNGLGALTGQSIAEGVRDPCARKVAAALLEEALRVTRAAGVRLETIPRVDPSRMLRLLTLGMPAFLREAILRLLVRIHPEARWSTWQSLAKGQPTEIDYLNGEIVRLAEEHGIDAPFNRAIVAMVKEAEARGAPPGLASVDVARRLGLG
jgi:2-dehydropantoate 2-reductase